MTPSESKSSKIARKFEPDSIGSVAVLGAGAWGGTIAWLLARAARPQDVTEVLLLVRYEDLASRVSEEGCVAIAVDIAL